MRPLGARLANPVAHGQLHPGALVNVESTSGAVEERYVLKVYFNNVDSADSMTVTGTQPDASEIKRLAIALHHGH